MNILELGMPAGGPATTLSCLRRTVASLEGNRACLEEGRRLSLGIAGIDQALGGGLALGALHEVSPSTAFDLGAACGFTLALAARAGGELLWIQPDFAGAEAGFAYGPGLDLFGFPSKHVLMLRVPRAVDVLWAMEEALKSRALATVVAEFTNGAAADLTATRRLVLAAGEGCGIGFLLLHRFSPAPSAAMTRWQVAAAESRPDAFGGLGHAAFDLSLVKNRYGPASRWSVTWDQHERVFSPLSFGLAAAARDRQDHAPLASAG